LGRIQLRDFNGRQKVSATALQFSRRKYVVLPSLLEQHHAASLYAYTLLLLRAFKWTGDQQLPDTPAQYADPQMEELLLNLLPRIEDASGLRLYPSYSYLRVYKRGDVLAMHLDRPACEISVSVNLGYKADAPWPLWIEGPVGVTSVEMEPGSALLYRGAECAHWRDRFSGEHSAQVMLHYVDQNGPHADWKFDKRTDLAIIKAPALDRL
jgi:alkylated DNA repair dioxygenase AlkB